jgi:hypothetical protein
VGVNGDAEMVSRPLIFFFATLQLDRGLGKFGTAGMLFASFLSFPHFSRTKELRHRRSDRA